MLAGKESLEPGVRDAAIGVLVRQDLAPHQVEQVAAQPAHELRLVRDRDDREPAQLAEARDRLHHQGGIGRVERGGGLVEQQGLRVAQERARDGHPLLLAAE